MTHLSCLPWRIQRLGFALTSTGDCPSNLKNLIKQESINIYVEADSAPPGEG